MIDQGFERKIILKLSATLLAALCIIFLSLYYVLPKSEISHYAHAIQSFIDADATLLRALIGAFIISSIILPGLVVLTAVFASHKIAGPVYRLHKSLDELATTRKSRHIKFRSYDQIKDTASSFNIMINGLDEHFREISAAYDEVEDTRKELDHTPESLGQLKEKVDRLGNALERFSL